MKKAWIIFLLTAIIAAQWVFMSSFQSVITVSHTGDKRAVVVSKLNYASMRATIKIIPSPHPDSGPVLVTFSNGSQITITETYSVQVFLPKTGDINSDYQFSTILSFTPISETEFSSIRLSHNNPIDVDVTPDVPENFLAWRYEPNHPDLQRRDEIDIYWLTVEGDATIAVSGYGAPF